jgi:CBS domain containing-hemolysin-like protein
MINRVMDAQSTTVHQAMKPMDRAVSTFVSAPVRDVLNLCRDRNITRLPVWDEGPGKGRVIGLVSLRTILFETGHEQKPIREYVKPALFLDEHLRLELALRRMQRSGQRLAIVLGQDRRETGIISLQDVLRMIFGEVSL